MAGRQILNPQFASTVRLPDEATEVKTIEGFRQQNKQVIDSFIKMGEEDQYNSALQDYQTKVNNAIVKADKEMVEEPIVVQQRFEAEVDAAGAEALKLLGDNKDLQRRFQNQTHANVLQYKARNAHKQNLRHIAISEAKFENAIDGLGINANLEYETLGPIPAIANYAASVGSAMQRRIEANAIEPTKAANLVEGLVEGYIGSTIDRSLKALNFEKAIEIIGDPIVQKHVSHDKLQAWAHAAHKQAERLHVNTVKTMIAKENPAGARIYYNGIKDNLPAGVQSQLLVELDEATKNLGEKMMKWYNAILYANGQENNWSGTEEELRDTFDQIYKQRAMWAVREDPRALVTWALEMGRAAASPLFFDQALGALESGEEDRMYFAARALKIIRQQNPGELGRLEGDSKYAERRGLQRWRSIKHRDPHDVMPQNELREYVRTIAPLTLEEQETLEDRRNLMATRQQGLDPRTAVANARGSYKFPLMMDNMSTREFSIADLTKMRLFQWEGGWDGQEGLPEAHVRAIWNMAEELFLKDRHGGGSNFESYLVDATGQFYSQMSPTMASAHGKPIWIRGKSIESTHPAKFQHEIITNQGEPRSELDLYVNLFDNKVPVTFAGISFGAPVTWEHQYDLFQSVATHKQQQHGAGANVFFQEKEYLLAEAGWNERLQDLADDIYPFEGASRRAMEWAYAIDRGYVKNAGRDIKKELFETITHPGLAIADSLREFIVGPGEIDYDRMWAENPQLKQALDRFEPNFNQSFAEWGLNQISDLAGKVMEHDGKFGPNWLYDWVKSQDPPDGESIVPFSLRVSNTGVPEMTFPNGPLSGQTLELVGLTVNDNRYVKIAKLRALGAQLKSAIEEAQRTNSAEGLKNAAVWANQFMRDAAATFREPGMFVQGAASQNPSLPEEFDILDNWVPFPISAGDAGAPIDKQRFGELQDFLHVLRSSGITPNAEHDDPWATDLLSGDYVKDVSPEFQKKAAFFENEIDLEEDTVGETGMSFEQLRQSFSATPSAEAHIQRTGMSKEMSIVKDTLTTLLHPEFGPLTVTSTVRSPFIRPDGTVGNPSLHEVGYAMDILGAGQDGRVLTKEEGEAYAQTLKEHLEKYSGERGWYVEFETFNHERGGELPQEKWHWHIELDNERTKASLKSFRKEFDALRAEYAKGDSNVGG